jgi:hypothetical protein
MQLFAAVQHIGYERNSNRRASIAHHVVEAGGITHPLLRHASQSGSRHRRKDQAGTQSGQNHREAHVTDSQYYRYVEQRNREDAQVNDRFRKMEFAID